MHLRIKLLPTLAICFLTIFSTFYFVHNYDSSLNNKVNGRPAAAAAAMKKVSNNSLIFYRAYWEQIDSSSVRIRLLTFSKCFLLQNLPNNFLQIELAYSSSSSDGNGNAINDNDKHRLQMEIRPIESECPWHWAPGCEWNSFVIDAYTTLGDIENHNIIVTNQDKSTTVTLPLIKSPDEYVDGLSVCIPPLYWYSDWLKLSFFIETWKLSGPNVHFYFYIQSISKTVKTVLKEYEREGIVTIIDWPILPNSTEENPNKSIYRFGHLLAQNDCRHRIKHRFGVVVDVDELILPLKPPTTALIEYLKTKMKTHPLAGSFTFKHSKLRFPNWPKTDKEWSENGLKWIDRVTVSDKKDGPTKAIFISDRADLISTHKIRKHFGMFSSVEIPANEAKLFHFRRNWTYKESEDDYESDMFEVFKDNITAGINSILLKVNKQLSNGLKLNNSVGDLVASCLKNWHDIGCKTPFTTCYEKLSAADEWVIADSSPYTVL